MAIAIDASTPAKVSSGSSTSTGHTAVTTASFTPPAGAKLIAFCAANNPSAGQTHSPAISGGSLTWTKSAQVSNGQNAGTDGMAAIFWADVASSAAMTVTLDDTNASAGVSSGWDAYLKVVVLTGAATGAPPSTVNHSASGTPTVTMTVAAGSALFGLNSDWSAAGTATAGANTTVYDEYLNTGQISVHVFRSTSLALSAGSNTISVTPATQQFNLVGVEVQVPGATSSGDVFWQLARVRATGPRQLTGPYSRQFQFGVDAPASGILTPITVTVTASSTVTVIRRVQPLLAATGTGTVTVARAVGKTLATAGTGTVTALRAVTKTLAVAGISAVSVALTKVKLVTVAVTGLSAVGIIRQIGKVTATTGTSSVNAVKALTRGVTTSGTGTVTALRNVRLVRAVTGTSTLAVLRTTSLHVTALGSGTVAAARRVALRASTTGSSVVSIARNVFTGGTQFTVSIAVTAASSVTLRRLVGLTHPITGSGAPTIRRRAALTTTASGTATVSAARRLAVAARTTGTAAIAISRRIALTVRLTGAYAIVVRLVTGAAQAITRGWSSTGTTSPSSSATHTDTTTTSKATVTIL